MLLVSLLMVLGRSAALAATTMMPVCFGKLSISFEIDNNLTLHYELVFICDDVEKCQKLHSPPWYQIEIKRGISKFSLSSSSPHLQSRAHHSMDRDHAQKLAL